MDPQTMQALFYAKAAAFLGAAFAIGIGSLGPALGQGIIAREAVKKIGESPENANNIKTVMFISLGIVETALIYLVIIAGALLYIGYWLTA